MSKKQRAARDSRINTVPDARVIECEPGQFPEPEPPIEQSPEVQVDLKPRRYSPPQCSACTALRQPNVDYTSVYSIRRDGEYIVRYCRCGFCGNTFKDLEKTV